MDTDALITIYLVVAARLLLPLAIPLFPLPAILACIVLDAADQSIMQLVGVDPPWYQGYDKALDIYYLAIAYIATMRNWENMAAFQVGRVLFYLRMAGVLAFELTGLRVLLAIFPNAFEPFFIYYEIVRRRGSPMRMTRRVTIAVVVVIWLVVKLPHEWWVHIAQLDATDFIKTKILGASLDTPFFKAIIYAPVVTGTLTVAAAIGVLVAWRLMEARKKNGWRLRPGSRMSMALAHWRRPAGMPKPSAAGRHLRWVATSLRVAAFRGEAASSFKPRVLVEKIVLVGVISVIFQQVLTGLKLNGIKTALFAAGAIVATDFVVRWSLRRFGVPKMPWAGIAGTAAINFFLVLLFQYIVPLLRPGHQFQSAVVFAALIMLFVTLYDHYRPVYEIREADALEAVGKIGIPQES